MLGALNREQQIPTLLRLRRLIELERELTPPAAAPSNADPRDAPQGLCVQQLLTAIAGETQMHQDAKTPRNGVRCTNVASPARSVGARRHRRHTAAAPTAADGLEPAVREVGHVQRLAYTRTQAAQALGVSRSTFDRRVLPLIETYDMSWGARLVPVDELERLLSAHRRKAQAEREPSQPRGRKSRLQPAIAARIERERDEGRSFLQIADGLNRDLQPTGQGGRQWWPSSVRAVVVRSRTAAGSNGTRTQHLDPRSPVEAARRPGIASGEGCRARRIGRVISRASRVLRSVDT